MPYKFRCIMQCRIYLLKAFVFIDVRKPSMMLKTEPNIIMKTQIFSCKNLVANNVIQAVYNGDRIIYNSCWIQYSLKFQFFHEKPYVFSETRSDKHDF